MFSLKEKLLRRSRLLQKKILTIEEAYELDQLHADLEIQVIIAVDLQQEEE